MNAITQFTPTQYAIFKEFSKAFERLNAPIDIQCAIGSLGDTLPDEAVLRMLQEVNTREDLWQDRNKTALNDAVVSR